MDFWPNNNEAQQHGLVAISPTVGVTATQHEQQNNAAMALAPFLSASAANSAAEMAGILDYASVSFFLILTIKQLIIAGKLFSFLLF